MGNVREEVLRTNASYVKRFGIATGLAFAFTFADLSARGAEGLKLNTPRGAVVEVIEEKPTGSGSFPVVVLAPGSGYHMRLPILERVAQALLKEGIGVIRFDWAYFVKSRELGTQSKDRAPEIEDMTTVLDFARNEPWVDRQRILVGGKSLGSIIAWRVLRASRDVKGALLLTPVCTRKEATNVAADNYPATESETRPVAWISGSHDPACETPVLLRFLGASAPQTRVDIVGGNHSFEPGAAPDGGVSPDADRTIDLVTRLSVDFARATLRSPARP